MAGNSFFTREPRLGQINLLLCACGGSGKAVPVDTTSSIWLGLNAWVYASRFPRVFMLLLVSSTVLTLGVQCKTIALFGKQFYVSLHLHWVCEDSTFVLTIAFTVLLFRYNIHRQTEQGGLTATLMTCIREMYVLFFAWTATKMSGILRSISRLKSVLHSDFIGPRQLPSKSFPLHLSPVILPDLISVPFTAQKHKQNISFSLSSDRSIDSSEAISPPNAI
jgi:hypothetical protein